MAFCDLHVHSTASDGTDPPGMLGQLAKQAGLSAIALTDHDTTDGLPAAAESCREHGIAFVPGIELSVDPGPRVGQPDTALRSGTLHILGLFIDPDDAQLADIRVEVKKARGQRNPLIIAKLQQLGVSITYDDVLALADQQDTAIIGRPHIAQVLVNRGYAKNINDAFRKYIGQGAEAYVRRDPLPAARAIDAVHHAGGLAVLAHPIQLRYEDPDELEHFTAGLASLGLDAVEIHHSDHSERHCRQYQKLAEKLGLLISGGSDYHGTRKSIALGSENVPFEIYQTLRNTPPRFPRSTPHPPHPRRSPTFPPQA